jgi:glucose-1-phosphatase
VTRCIVFDFGNVIALFDHMLACQRLASLSRPPRDPQDVYDRIFKTSLEEDYDCGRLSTATFVERLRRDLQLEASDETIARAWCDIFTPNPAIEEVIVREKRKGTRLVLASNTNELHHDWFDRVFADTLSVFDARVLSYQVGSRKPDRHFFAACLTAAGWPASSCLYVDDRADFVAAGRVLGLTGLVYAPGVDVQAATCY